MALTTEQRAEINRRNASNSTGPRSQEGKDKSRANAWRHGLTARTVAPASPEEAAEYAERRRHWHHDMRPQNVLEAAMIDRACRAKWKLDICTTLEDPMRAAARAQAPSEETSTPSAPDAGPTEGPDTPTDAGPELDHELLMRYEAAAERELHRAVNTFLRLRKDPELVPPPPEPFVPRRLEPAPEPKPAAVVPTPGPSAAPRAEPASPPSPRRQHPPVRNEATVPASTAPHQPSEAPRREARQPLEGPKHGGVS